jgi:lipopolysaccharide/colanic/teichoic acid biosynthesis glycosyltransferase
MVYQRYFKRVFDFLFSLFLLIFLLIPILLLWVIAAIETRSNGFFVQERVGYMQKIFKVYKIKTMLNSCEMDRIASLELNRITYFGAFFRKYKLDELPQLINILKGDMSFVGPRPDTVKGLLVLSPDQADIVFSVRPGVTSPASLKYRSEEKILATKNDPENFYWSDIFPDKTRMNIDYVGKISFFSDLLIVIKTVSI